MKDAAVVCVEIIRELLRGPGLARDLLQLPRLRG